MQDEGPPAEWTFGLAVASEAAVLVLNELACDLQANVPVEASAGLAVRVLERETLLVCVTLLVCEVLPLFATLAAAELAEASLPAACASAEQPAFQPQSPAECEHLSG